MPDVCFNRGLSDDFLQALLNGTFAPLMAAAKQHELDVQIREHYLDFYKHGRRILELTGRAAPFRATLHIKYIAGTQVDSKPCKRGKYYADFRADEAFVIAFTQCLAQILTNASSTKKMTEATVEEKLIFGSLLPESPLIFIDRQVQFHNAPGKLDLIGLASGTNDPARLILTELKRELDNRIQKLHIQMEKYWRLLDSEGNLRPDVLQSYQRVIRQKKALGLLPGAVELDDSPTAECLIILYDYNVKSRLLDRCVVEWPAYLPTRFVLLNEGTTLLPPEEEWLRPNQCRR